MRSLGSIIVFILSFLNVLSNEIYFIINIKHSDCNEIQFYLDILNDRSDYIIEYRDIYDEMLHIKAENYIYIPNIKYENGYASFVITDNKLIFEKIIIRYNNENVFLNYDYNELYFKPFYYSSNKVLIKNNIESRLVWENPYQVFDENRYYFNVDELLSLRYQEIPFIKETYLIIEKPRDYYKYLIYDEYLSGYKILLNYEFIENKIHLYFKDMLYYDIVSFQPTLFYKSGYEMAKGIYFLKNELNSFIKVNINLVFDNFEVKIPIEIISNNQMVYQKNNISLFEF